MSHQPLNVLITKKADTDEEAVYQYISHKFGKIYADKFRSAIIKLFKKPALTPTAGRIAGNDPTVRVFIFNRQNKIVYTIAEINLLIIRILNVKTEFAAKY